MSFIIRKYTKYNTNMENEKTFQPSEYFNDKINFCLSHIYLHISIKIGLCNKHIVNIFRFRWKKFKKIQEIRQKVLLIYKK